MTRVTTFGPAPDTLLPDELNNIQDDYERIHQLSIPLLSGFVSKVHLGNPAGSDALIGPAHTMAVPQLRSSGVAGNPNPAAMIFWHILELVLDTGFTPRWRLRSTLMTGGTSIAMNAPVRVGVRHMTGDWDGRRPGGAATEFQSSVWEAAPGHMSVTHPASTSVQYNDTQIVETLPPITFGDPYALFMDFPGAAPNASTALSHLWVDLSLRILPPWSDVTAPVLIGSSTKAASINSNTVAITTATAAAIGDTILVSGHFKSADVDLSSVSDSAGNAYTIDLRNNPTDFSRATFIARSVVTATLPIGGTITATINQSRAESKALIAAKVGALALSPSSAALGRETNSASFATDEAIAYSGGRLLFGAVSATANTAVTPSAGFTELVEKPIDTFVGEAGYRLLTTSGSYPYSGAFGVATGSCAAVMVYDALPVPP